MNLSQPVLIICFGVSGCGKTTLAEFLAEQFSFQYVEADDFHPPENKASMASGKPLTDAMREPWIVALGEFLSQQFSKQKSCVMANSCLRKAYRQRFRNLGVKTLFIHLSGPKDLIFRRMKSRENHFMPAELLDSQFDTLELPDNESDVLTIDISQNINEIAAEAKEKVNFFLNNSEGSLES